MGCARPDRVCGTSRTERIGIVSAVSISLSPPLWESRPTDVDGVWRTLSADGLPADYRSVSRQLARRVPGQGGFFAWPLRPPIFRASAHADALSCAGRPHGSG